MKHEYLIAAVLFASGPFAAAEITVKPMGMQVIWDDGGETFGGFKTFNHNEGVQVSFLLESDGASFIKIDDDASKVKIGGQEADCSFFGQQSELSKDGKKLRIEFDAKEAKAEGGKVPVSGEIVVQTASKKGEVASNEVEWKKGAVLKFPEESGMPAFTIDKVGKPEWGDEEFEVTLKCNKDYPEPAGVKFIDENGKEQEADRSGSMRMGFGKMVKIEVSYKAKKAMTKGKMVVEYWKDLEKVSVPVEFKLGLEGAK